jgi:hypothetical protein
MKNLLPTRVLLLFVRKVPLSPKPILCSLTLMAVPGICAVAVGQTPAGPSKVEVDKTERLPSEQAADKSLTAAEKWVDLLPPEGLDGWEVTDFYGHGEAKREGTLLVLEEGKPLTGITYKKEQAFPTSNYEIELRARRTRGNDFLCGLTFPVGKDFCSFIAGGWGGGLVGLSSIDGADASENSTTTYHDFKNDHWYHFKISVDDEFIRCQIDGQEVILQERENHQFSTRIEVYASQPLGLCVYRSRVEVQDFRWRPLNDGGR